MAWYHYALLFYWAVSGFWLFTEHPQRAGFGWLGFTLCFAFGWLALPVAIIVRALR